MIYRYIGTHKNDFSCVVGERQTIYIYIMKRERKRKRPHATIYHFYHNIYFYIWRRCVHVVYYTGCLVLSVRK